MPDPEPVPTKPVISTASSGSAAPYTLPLFFAFTVTEALPIVTVTTPAALDAWFVSAAARYHTYYVPAFFPAGISEL